jgi:hypothetical protein
MKKTENLKKHLTSLPGFGTTKQRQRETRKNKKEELGK